MSIFSDIGTQVKEKLDALSSRISSVENNPDDWVANLEYYANDTLAGQGGISIGQPYRISNTSPTLSDVRIRQS